MRRFVKGSFLGVVVIAAFVVFLFRGEKFGGSITDFEKVLSSGITSSQTTIPLNNLRLTDGVTDLVVATDLSGQIFVAIDQEKSEKREIAVCTGSTTSTSPQLTGCTRGLAFYGSTTTGNVALRRAHNTGAKVTVDDIHYTYSSSSAGGGIASEVDTLQTVTDRGSSASADITLTGELVAASTTLTTLNYTSATGTDSFGTSVRGTTITAGPNNGLCTAPRFTFENDPNTGLTQSGADTISSCVAGSEALRIRAADILFFKSIAVNTNNTKDIGTPTISLRSIYVSSTVFSGGVTQYTTSTVGPILTASGGACFRLGINDAGGFTTTSVTCL